MEIYFLRHGRAQQKGSGVSEEERQLTDEGLAQSEAVARFVQSKAVAVAAVVSSPLVRAVQTAEKVAAALAVEAMTDQRLTPGTFTAAELADVISELGDPEAVLLAGHEPDFSTTISDLIGGGAIKLGTAGLALVEGPAPRSGSCHLHWLVQSAI